MSSQRSCKVTSLINLNIKAHINDRQDSSHFFHLFLPSPIYSWTMRCSKNFCEAHFSLEFDFTYICICILLYRPSLLLSFHVTERKMQVSAHIWPVLSGMSKCSFLFWTITAICPWKMCSLLYGLQRFSCTKIKWSCFTFFCNKTSKFVL